MSKILTPDDVIRAGACVSGVRDWMREHAPMATALTVEQAMAFGTDAEHILKAAGLAGDGDGDGNGDGYGYGNGNGYGDGDGEV
jgi:hypothetical protein